MVCWGKDIGTKGGGGVDIGWGVGVGVCAGNVSVGWSIVGCVARA